MAKLILLDKFTIEVPLSNGEFDVIEGQMRPITKKFEKELQEKYSDNTKRGKELRKKNKELLRLEDRIQTTIQRIDLEEDKTLKLEMLNKKDEMLDKAYAIADFIETEQEYLMDLDPQETRAKEIIQNLVKCDVTNLEKLNKICENYGYKLCLDTILEGVKEGKQEKPKD